MLGRKAWDLQEVPGIIPIPPPLPMLTFLLFTNPASRLFTTGPQLCPN
ncbi:MAG: hypothetical protein K2Q22_09085 [Cytophagales bacterium]|nr:hypothetical protein [Cytophagales bacterium]